MNKLSRKLILEAFVEREDKDNMLKLAVIGLGQAGGKIAQEFSRLGVYTLAINTATSDLNDLSDIEDGNKIVLGSMGGASKDISVGRQAVLDNQDAISDALLRPEIVNADFVFVIAGLGGGTGNGSLPTITNALYNARKHKMFKNRPTNAVIISVPGSWEKRGLKKNAVAGLAALQKLIDSNRVGSVLIADNDKLANRDKLNWESSGNKAIASTLYELIVSSSLPQVNAFDKSEFMDVFSSSGYLTVGKRKLTDNTIEDNELIQIVNKTFKENSVFADGYEYGTDSKIGAFVVIRPKNEIITSEHKNVIEATMNKVLSGAEITHYGLINNSVWGTNLQPHKKETDEQYALLYSLAVLESYPTRVREMIETINKEEKEIEEARQNQNEKLNLGSFMDMFSKKEAAAASDQSSNNLFEDEDLFDSKPNPKSDNKRPSLFEDEGDL